MSTPKLFCTLSFLAVLALGAGCGADAEPPPQLLPATTVEDAAAFSGAANDDVGGEVTARATAQRMIIHNATLELKADDPDSVIADAIEIAEHLSGHAAASETSSEDGAVQMATATLRVPSTVFEQTLSELRDHGDLLHETVSGDDVTEQYVDLEARLHAQETLEKRLLLLVGQSSSVEETLKVEQELARVRGNVESLEAQTRSLAERSAMATIELRVYSPTAQGAPGFTSEMAEAASDAREACIRVMGGLVRILGVLAPFYLVGFPVFLLIRRRQRRLAGLKAGIAVPPRS
jgi:hypothetical protein